MSPYEIRRLYIIREAIPHCCPSGWLDDDITREVIPHCCPSGWLDDDITREVTPHCCPSGWLDDDITREVIPHCCPSGWLDDDITQKVIPHCCPSGWLDDDITQEVIPYRIAAPLSNCSTISNSHLFVVAPSAPTLPFTPCRRVVKHWLAKQKSVTETWDLIGHFEQRCLICRVWVEITNGQESLKLTCLFPGQT